ICSSRDPHKLLCWDPESGQLVDRLDGAIIEKKSRSFLPDGKFIAILGEGDWLRLWDVGSDKGFDFCEIKPTRSVEVKWMQGLDSLYLVTLTDGIVGVWKLVEKDDARSVHLVWEKYPNNWQ
ncbi:hypothetical protein BGX29_001412, partial [Mortierella sp. GBA35]